MCSCSLPEQSTCQDPPPLQSHPDGAVAGTGDVRYLWDAGETIKIAFMGGQGTIVQRNTVRLFASEWLGYAFLKFEWIDHPQFADVRISFDETIGSWSYVGSIARLITNPDRATMNFGWVGKYGEEADRRVILHEFGHVLGMMHEHRRNEMALRMREPRPNWYGSIIDDDMHLQTDYDDRSIMHYPIADDLTIDGEGVLYTSELSHLDKRWANLAYPFPTDYKVFIPNQ